MTGYCRVSPGVYEVSLLLCSFENKPKGITKDISRWLWHLKRTPYRLIRHQKDREGINLERCELTLARSRHKYASLFGCLHSKACCVTLEHECPYDKVCFAWTEDKIRYRAGFRDRLIGRRPCIKIDPCRKNF